MTHAPMICPKCNSKNISTQPEHKENHGDKIIDQVICNNCHVEWKEFYNYDRFEFIGE